MLVQCYSMLSTAAVYGNELLWYVLYSRAGPVILGSAESAMPCYLSMMLIEIYCISSFN